MANERRVGVAGRTDGHGPAALYLADVVERFDRDGLTVERAVVESGHGGRLVFDTVDPAGGPGGWWPLLAGWDPSTGWDVLLAGRGPATRRVRLCAGSIQPPADELVATVRSLLAPDARPSTADASVVAGIGAARVTSPPGPKSPGSGTVGPPGDPARRGA